MRGRIMLLLLGTLALTGCSHQNQLNRANLVKPLDAYLASDNTACVSIGGRFPINIPMSLWSVKGGQTGEMMALQQAGLVRSTKATVIVHNADSALTGLYNVPQPVKRYEVTEKGRKYLHRVRGTFGPNDGFCYGKAVVASIVNWTKPVTHGNDTETLVTYTYRIEDVANWAKSSAIESEFPEMKITRNNAGKDLSTPMHRTARGWLADDARAS